MLLVQRGFKEFECKYFYSYSYSLFSLFIGRVIKLNIRIYQLNNFRVKGTCVQFVVQGTSTGTSGNIVRINTREFISIHVLFVLNSSMTR